MKSRYLYKMSAVIVALIFVIAPILTLTAYAAPGIGVPPPGNPVPNAPSEPSKPLKPSQPIGQPLPSKSPAKGKPLRKVVVVPASKTPSSAEEEKVSTKPQVSIIKKTIPIREKPESVRDVESRGVVKLITGDVVQFAKVKGRYAVSVKPTDPSKKFFTLMLKDRLYVIPAGVDLRKFDIELFDVTYLAKYYAKLGKLPLIVKVAKTVAVPPKGVLSRYLKEIPGATGKAFKIIKAFSLAVPYKEIEKAYVKLAKDPSVVKVYLDRVVFVRDVPISAKDFKVKLYESAQLVGATYAKALGINGTGIKIAILDTGIDPTHPDFYFPNGTSKIVANASFVDYNFDGTPDENVTDLHGHGTHCAGIAAGTGLASNGSVVGVAPGASLIIGKVLSNYGWGYDSWIISGIEWAIERGANVVSMSLGGWPVLGYDPLEDAVKNATEQGVVMVIAAGNEGPEFFTVSSPGTTPEAITVAAVDKYLEPAWFTSVGPTVKLELKPDIAAPGVDIASARANHTYMGPPASKYYVFASGTSMATPHVAGLVALIEEALRARAAALNQSIPITPKDVKYLLMNYAQDLPYSPFVVGSGFANITTLVSDIMNTSKVVAYVVPPTTTLKGGSGNQTISVKVRVFCGYAAVNKTLLLEVGPGIMPWYGANPNQTAMAITGVSPEFLNVVCTSPSEVIERTVNITINWDILPAGFHVMGLYLKSANFTVMPYEVRTYIGLFKTQTLKIKINAPDSIGQVSSSEIAGFVAVVPEFPVGYFVPDVFEFSSLPAEVTVPIVVPGVTYDVLVAASYSNLLITTTLDSSEEGFTNPNATNFVWTIDIGQQIDSGFLKHVAIDSHAGPGLSTPFFVVSEAFVNEVGVAIYTFSNYVDVYAPRGLTSWSLAGSNSTYVVWPALEVMWPEGNVIRAYYTAYTLPDSGSEVFSSVPNYEAKVVLRRIGSELVYVPFNVLADGVYSISPQYGFMTPKEVKVLIYSNTTAQGILTPAILYVQDSEGNDVGYVELENPYLTYSPFYEGVAYTDPLRMPYGSTIWWLGLSSWKGIDGEDYPTAYEYVRFLDSWWMSYGMVSAWTTLYINGKAIMTSLDDDPGVLLYLGWDSIGKAPNATVELASGATLDWAGDYIDFHKSLGIDYSVLIRNLPTNISTGVPAYPIWGIDVWRVPGVGVQFINITPLTMSNIVPRNLTTTGTIEAIINAWISPYASAPTVTIAITNATGHVIEYAGVLDVIDLGKGFYYVIAQFNLTTLPTGEYGLVFQISSEYNVTTVYNTTVTLEATYTYSTYPAMKVAPLILAPIYVGSAPYCNYSSIADAVAAAYPNQTIYVLPGTYYEGDIVINKPLKIIGVEINGSVPVIVADGHYYAFQIDGTPATIANMEIVGPYTGVYAYSATSVYLENLTIVGSAPAVMLYRTTDSVLRNIDVISTGVGGYGIMVFGLDTPGSFVMNNVVVDEKYGAPIVFSHVRPDVVNITCSNIYVNESGTLRPVIIYSLANRADEVRISPSYEYVVVLAYNMSDLVLSNVRLKWLNIYAEASNITLSGVTFINRTYVTYDRIDAFAGSRATLDNVVNLQALAPGVYTYLSHFIVYASEVNINNSVLSTVYIPASYASVNVVNTKFLTSSIRPSLFLRRVGSAYIAGCTFKGIDENKTVLAVFADVTATSVYVVNSSFTHYKYGIIVYSTTPKIVIKGNVFTDVTAPVTLLPPGTPFSWMFTWASSKPPIPGLPKDLSQFLTESNTFSPSTSSTSSPVASGLNATASHVIVYSNTFSSYSVCINASLLSNSSLVLVNNTFSSTSPPVADVLVSGGGFTGIWLNVFKSSPTKVVINSSEIFLNFNNFFGTTEVSLAGSSADVRWNYVSGHYSLTAYGGLNLTSGPPYATPLDLPLKSLVPIIEFEDHTVLTVGMSEVVGFRFVNPYDINLIFTYRVEGAPGIEVLSGSSGTSEAPPAYEGAYFVSGNASVKAVSPGNSSVYVVVNGFRYSFPIKVLPASVNLAIEAPTSVLRGSTFPVKIKVWSNINATLRGALVITLSNQLEIRDPARFRYATSVIVPINISNATVVVPVNVTALTTGNAYVSAKVYVAGISSLVNSSRASITVSPNPYVSFTIKRIYYENVTEGRFSYIALVIEGDPQYTLLLNVTFTSRNTTALMLGYGGDEESVSYLVRTDPDARLAHVYVPIKGINPGTATVDIEIMSVGDGVGTTASVTITVNPKLVWAYVSNSTVVSDTYNTSSMTISYPPTTLKAKLYLLVYASKISASYEALKYLMGIPWGCVEQTTSPLLSDIELYRYISERELWSNVSSVINKTLLESYIRKGADKLLNHHLGCNATHCWFSWYPTMKPTKFFTIYGTLGLITAYEFAHVDYPTWYGSVFDLGVNETVLNESISKLLKTIVELRNSEGYWSYPEGVWDYITDEVPLTSLAIYVLSKALQLGYLPSGYSRSDVISVINEAVAWLESQQLASGGWKPNAASSEACPYASAYALMALGEAAKAGATVDTTVIEKGITYLSEVAKGGSGTYYWVPYYGGWRSWWALDPYVATAEVVLALATVNASPIASSLPQTYIDQIGNLTSGGAKFLILTANEWMSYPNTEEGSTILRALNSIGADLTFGQPLTVRVQILGNGVDLLFSKDYTITGRYDYYVEKFDLSSNGWLSSYKNYTFRAEVLSGKGEAVIVAYSYYGYRPTKSGSTSASSSVPRAVGEESVAKRSVTLVLGGKTYVIEQAPTTTAQSSSEPGIEVTVSVSKPYVTSSEATDVSIKIKPVNAQTLYAVVVEEDIPPGFRAVINTTALGDNVAFDEDRYNKSGGTIVSRSGSELVLEGGTLAFAVGTVGSEGVTITYELVPVNVSCSRVTLPTAKAWLFYSPIGKKIEGESATTPTITVGLPMTVSLTSEVISRGATVSNNSAISWGDKVGILITLPQDVQVTLEAYLVSNETSYTIVKENVSGGSKLIYLDTLKLAGNVSKFEDRYVELKILVKYGNLTIASKTYRLYMPKVSKLDLFKRMADVEARYVLATQAQKQVISTEEIEPLKKLWSSG